MAHGVNDSNLNGNDMRVLVVLLEKGTSNLSGLSDAVSNQATRKSTMKKLARMGLVEYEVTDSRHLSYKVTLTGLGAQTAILLALSEECLAGNLDIDRDSLDEKARDMMAAVRSRIQKTDGDRTEG